MQSLGSLARNIKPNQNIVEEEHNLKCERCGNTYDYYKFSNGQEFRHGCECELIEIGKKERAERKEKYLNRIFNQSNVNASLSDATVNSYQPQNEHQVHAKSTAIEYVKGFSIDEPKSLILQGSYGTGKSHLAYAVAKAIKQQGYSVAFMHIPMLMERIKATYNRNATETTDELVQLLSSIDLLVLDDIGVENTEHTLNKLFSIVDNRVGKNNIFTTNFSDKELNQNMNWQRINSRMKQNARTVRVLGDDFRGRDAW
ncbi:DNA replication protein DnaC [Staphylococcus sp. HMSC068D03]|uniref:ATP-binding protein n=1 Tax=Staphylococcus TaxID=1279 RepID=UPI000660DAB9|nr:MULTISPECIES: ATP-binding protein [Staphylococcus]MBD3928526.1 ATP-binding protein [Staphylococcus haemolyticus]MBF2216166.1 ATP-binding protein [Staphylococcus haemolyticus]MBF2221842.1 ATP-binding protein [Staphylococcus haemolyticus]MBF2235737.1 ATP-binding protein [Staphylococcus haemolyticus]MCF7580371.1 ATP-binding protein [Staphylococcus aureus]